MITEKATLTGTYVFEVQAEANKTEISKAVKQMYGVLPKSVNIIKVKGKKVRSGQRAGQRKDWKKAVVSLNKGETIKVYEGA
ncbi:MAG: 50S ribosomal protein L23 [Candidatus Kerfeldbacteria bacterium RIFOXYA2_FULL_38_24]|uniref:Large ribosomal subunit protein uL23 n=1 Tax=Candidatus Kerfeldbacteria bacterium RIFOXYB2_FULL_38_14 TaxID=1798547 RepID=A0A1G2BF13_9BACT|nr:MAG: 50S ribosomal protein L23 [Candidatus Kerfeldbacteria bacterium RIFOXYB2_FULL_38_14]OGY87964.1 MAG: 50S ribosomal protein L23 [Candidatus Kerfeldbacteria bacterium RIFOXYA2_FULL_38_24]OGY88704.1 MAG: 50S ribosomal protein L23 [Candidatus Kerfeldbacteria bacterium RIFOXYC2_FULL_38_9]